MAERILIKADREYLREVFAKIESGEYAVPVFQRDYVWKSNQIIDLFDSILHGYPIGSLVLWKADDLRKSKNILTDVITEAPAPQYFILDGRQRLTTLYGCISQNQKKDARFNLCYNLDRDVFEFPQKESVSCVPVSTVYDTFSLLGWLQMVQEQVHDTSLARTYQTKAKNLNSLLQEYILSEIYISDCSLEEAGVVFSRINSKGTMIESLDMLQAIKYKGDDSDLISSYIRKIQKSLEPFDFQGISPKDILNCCFWFTERKYYDARIQDLDKVNLEEIFPKVEAALLRAVSFLRSDCGVLSSRLLPYTKQLQALVWYFKDADEPLILRRAELRRWFFYTTYTQMFMNGALQHIRNIHNKFEVFIQAKADDAWDYEPVNNPSFDWRFSSKSAQARFMTLSVIHKYMKEGIAPERMSFTGYEHPFGNSPLCYIPRIMVDGVLQHDLSDTKLAEYVLTGRVKEAIFIRSRNLRISKLEINLLEDAGIEIESQEEPTLF